MTTEPGRARLVRRLIVTHVAVVLVGVTVAGIAIRLVLPRWFSSRTGRGLGAGRGSELADDLHDALTASIDRSLVVAAAISLVLAGVAAWAMARRLARPIQGMGVAAQRMAAGDYAVRASREGLRELDALAVDLNVLAERLESTERSRRRLLTDLTHELRTPVATVGSYLEAFQDGLMEPSPDLLAELSDEVARIERLIGDLALLSRIDEHQVSLSLAPHDPAVLVSRVAERLAPQFAAAGVSLAVDTVPGSVVSIDEDRIVQVVTNLVGNALRYTPPGGSVRVSCSAGNGSAVVEVSDDGPGIAPEELDRIFDRFQRGAGTSGIGGTGVGLTIARSLARLHGGDVVARSAGLGHGSTFELRLPLAS
ncbi:MAG: ATP-binding protein [Ilumatobacteraceae bacterium]